MTNEPAHAPAGRTSAGALILCGALGIVFGAMAALNVAGRMVPPATEARVLMQLLEIEYGQADEALRAATCQPPAPERLQMITTLVAMIPLALADTLVVDEELQRKSRELQAGVRRLGTERGCPGLRSALRDIDAACRDCHDQYRTGG